MGSKIVVNPAQLSQASARIKQQVQEYRSLYAKLFSDVDAMSAAWRGTDNIAFTTQIAGFRPDFDAMATMMDQYATFLAGASQKYTQTQEKTITEAKGLQA